MTSESPQADVTRMLKAIDCGDPQAARTSNPGAADGLLNLVYDQLRKIAQQRMSEERRGHTLQATALVHEAYLRLVGDSEIHWQGRAHFFAAAAEAMRRILIDHSRRRGAAKRSGRPLSLHGVADLASEERIEDAMSLDESILRLEKADARAAQVVRLRFYAGLSIDDTAGVLGVDPRTVKRDWEFARAWLAADLK